MHYLNDPYFAQATFLRSMKYDPLVFAIQKKLNTIKLSNTIRLIFTPKKVGRDIVVKPKAEIW